MIKLQVTLQGKKIRISIGRKIPPSAWHPDKREVKGSQANYAMLNGLIRAKSTEIENFIIQRQVAGKTVTVGMIKRSLGILDASTVSEFVSGMIESLQGKFSEDTLTNYRGELKRITAFSPDITFEEIDHEWLRKYDRHMTETGLSENTRHKAFKILAKFFSSARIAGVTSHYPFPGFNRPKYRQTDRTYLTEKEVDKMEALLELPLDPMLRIACSYFVFGCYSGLRVSDWQRFTARSYVKDGRLILRAKKNGELISMLIHSRLQVAIDRLNRPCISDQKVNEALKVLAKMAGIDKVLTTHVARHSFAVRCAELGISVESCAALMGITIKTCGYYYKVTGRKLDEDVKKWG